MNSPAKTGKKARKDWLVGQRIDRYHILQRLASGGMGAVYVARATAKGGFERLVAIKVLHPHLADEEEFISMLLDEARLAARIRHPNVVATLDVSDWEDLHYLVMDYVEGDHLAALLTRAFKTKTRLPLRPALRIIYEAIAGLTAAHELTDGSGNALNLVHRDVSPQNILVGVDGISRLTDFGVAKAEYRLSSTRQGTFKGKLAYTAPETASQAHAEQRSDLFAMGIVLWEVLTTHRLFKAETNVATLKKLLDEPIPPPSSISADLAPFDAVLKKALARPLDERFQSGAEMMEALEEAATATVGMGTNREVAALVREVAATKLAKEQAAIREAVERLGGEAPKAYSTGQHGALGANGTPSQPPTIAAKSVSELISTGGPAEPPQVTKKNTHPAVWISVGVLAVAAAVGGTVAFMSNGDASSVEAPPAEETPAPEEVVVEEVVVEEVVVEEVVEETAEEETAEVDEIEAAETPEAPEMRRRSNRGMRPRMRRAADDDVLSNPYRSN
ncbi:MAG: serine/threonine protein kinase [Deltaproteobacteria bacterium]|nr:MAG: serine/threonine protein kinase [Deltaproteobacteria bacterium]